MQGGIVLKKQSNLSRLLSYAGGHKYFTYVSWILSAVCALTALVPFWYIWKIINEVLKASPNFGSAQNLTHYGIMAMAYAIISYLIYIGALLCSHLAAFRIAANMRAYCKAAHRLYRQFRQRKAAQNYKRLHCGDRNLSCTSAAG